MHFKRQLTTWGKYITAALWLMALSCVQAGTITFTSTSPALQDHGTGADKKHYIFINKDDAKNTGISFACTATPTNGTVNSYSWNFPGGTPSSSNSQNPGTVKFASAFAGITYTCTLGLDHTGSGTPAESCTTTDKIISRIKVVIPEIIPDTGQAGTTGDRVPSNKGATVGEQHYVSPKKASDFVILKADTPIPAADFGTFFEWDTTVGEAVSGSADKWKVSRATTGKFVVKLKRKSDNAEVARLNVWIVWSTATATPNAIGSQAGNIQTGDNTSGPGLVTRGGYDYTFTIAPAAIITDADRPELSGANTTPVPGANQRHVLSNNKLTGGADHKWDCSRQIRFKILNPNLIPVAQLTKNAGHVWTGQPAASTTPEDYPIDPALGNDDTHTGEPENNDPYNNNGKINALDTPAGTMRNSSGADGNTFERRLQFIEFLRLEIAGTWYRVSDDYLWRAHFKHKRIGGAWTDDGSDIAQDNAGF